jgi:hypothetical protein
VTMRPVVPASDHDGIDASRHRAGLPKT